MRVNNSSSKRILKPADPLVIFLQTTSNGLTWSQYLGLNNPGTTTPYPSFYSFAQGGAVVNRTIGGSGGLFNESNPVDFVAQYLLWDEAFAPPPPSVPWTGEDSLFAIWFGINDV